ncbi:EamA domain-containing membrane protein RarD [Palleronia salina]|uniref:EamA domain-containing membrane protein RarD n=1 Tax=Palleronia salina TaxID=313368 RepID=A0A1M6DL54_9RHOB|nr:DMT family transporter [Palleronia salina]SHI73986.1 EamA domain-containing membrane protein RarD [Palleronia salina]
MSDAPAPAGDAAPRPLVAVAIMVVAMSLIPVGDAFNKAAANASDHAPVTLAWWRFAVGTVLVLPVALGLARDRRPRRAFLAAAALRGALIGGGIVCITTALTQVPLADAFGAFFIGPFVAMALARIVLGEPVAPRDWAAAALGFAGVLLVVRPGAEMQPGVLWAVGAGCFYGTYITATRATAHIGRPLSQLAGQLVAGLILLLPLALADPVPLWPQVPGLLVGSGAASGTGNLLAIVALSLGATGLLAPLIYTQLLVAAVLSVLVFGDPISGVAAFGMTLIVLAGLSRVVSRA